MITGKTAFIAHIGWPTHSFRAPMIYNPYFEQAGIDAVVVPMGCKPEHYAGLLRPLFTLENIAGALITMPHKVSTVALLDDIAQADTRELVEIHRDACRYCWGIGHRYQRTAAELERAQADHAAAQQADANLDAFDPQGGGGFNGKAKPSPECPECFGDGIARVHIHDTRTLSPRAARIFAGAKVTKDGIEIKTHSQVEALQLLARHQGLFTDTLNVRLKGKVAHTHDAVGELRAFLATRGSRLPITTEGEDHA